MTETRPADVLDEIHRLRTQRNAVAVDALATSVWDAAQSGTLLETAGLGAVCQAAFVSATAVRGVDDGTQASAVKDNALLWRARAHGASVENGELNTQAMLLIPLAFEANGRGLTDVALAILEEVGRLADEIERCGLTSAPGVSLQLVRRVQHEKRGYLLWRRERYADGLDAYSEATHFVAPNTRDEGRVAAGRFLCELGLEQEASETIDLHRAASSFDHLADIAEAGEWADVSEPLRRNARALREGRASGVQELEPVEHE